MQPPPPSAPRCLEPSSTPPPAGTVESTPGTFPLKVVFTPNDNVDFTTNTKTVQLLVLQQVSVKPRTATALTSTQNPVQKRLARATECGRQALLRYFDAGRHCDTLRRRQDTSHRAARLRRSQVEPHEAGPRNPHLHRRIQRRQSASGLRLAAAEPDRSDGQLQPGKPPQPRRTGKVAARFFPFHSPDATGLRPRLSFADGNSTRTRSRPHISPQTQRRPGRSAQAVAGDLWVLD